MIKHIPYKKIFNETFESQKDIYEIADSIENYLIENITFLWDRSSNKDN